jgi:hypothetical protein
MSLKHQNSLKIIEMITQDYTSSAGADENLPIDIEAYLRIEKSRKFLPHISSQQMKGK